MPIVICNKTNVCVKKRVKQRVTPNIASDYWTNRLYQTPNPNLHPHPKPSPLAQYWTE